MDDSAKYPLNFHQNTPTLWEQRDFDNTKSGNDADNSSEFFVRFFQKQPALMAIFYKKGGKRWDGEGGATF